VDDTRARRAPERHNDVMTARTCPACGLQQTLAAPRCARCGAPLEQSMKAAPAAGPAPVEDRTVFRPGLATVPPGEVGGQPRQLPVQPGQPDQSDQPGRPINIWPGGSERPHPVPDQPSAALAGTSGQTGQQVPPAAVPSGQSGQQVSPDTDPASHTHHLPPGAVPDDRKAAAQGPSALQRLWRRIIGAPAQPDPAPVQPDPAPVQQDPPGDAPRE